MTLFHVFEKMIVNHHQKARKAQADTANTMRLVKRERRPKDQYSDCTVN